METATYCAYNITRKALLSEHAAAVSNIQDPAQLLALVLNGPGRDPKSAVFLRGISGTIDIPRLFAFDVAFLDDEHKIIEAAGVGPGTPFPPLARAVASILFLSDQCLAKSSTVPGDVIKICTEAELAVLLRAASQTQPADTFQQPKILSEMHLDLRQSIEPFDGSLIYLPTSGTPQSSEFFLPIAAPRAHAPDPLKEQIIELTPVELSASEAQIVNRPGPIEPPESPGNFGTDLDDSEVPGVDTSEPVRFLVLPTVRETHGAKQGKPTPGNESPHPPQLTGLSPQLKAIIEKVDEQLRRERETPEEREQIPQGKGASAISDLTHPADSIQTEQTPAGLHQQFPTPPQAENTEPVSSASIQITQDLNDEIHAAPPDELAAAEPLPPPPRQISRSKTKASRARKVSRKAHPASTDRKSDPKPAELHPGIERQPMPPQPTPAQENPRPPVPRSDDTIRAIPAPSERKLSFAIRVQRWLAGESISLTGNRRRGERINVPGLVAFYWTGGAPTPHEIVNISKSGLYLRSKELWSPDTLVRMTLERPGAVEGEQKSISVLVRVVRSDDGGVAHEFVTTEVLDHLRARDIVPEQGTNRKNLEKFLELH
jgi:hypothetical protein